mgnify:CR=1 FL=1
MQALPLESKITMTKHRIQTWVDEFGIDGVYVSFSGGKDSTVLLDIARQEYPDMKAMFVDVPTQYPELKEFVLTFDNVDIVHPKISFAQVCERYGFPFFSKEIASTVNEARKYFKKVDSMHCDDKILTNERTNERTNDTVRLSGGGFARNRPTERQRESLVQAFEDGDYP